MRAGTHSLYGTLVRTKRLLMRDPGWAHGEQLRDGLFLCQPLVPSFFTLPSKAILRQPVGFSYWDFLNPSTGSSLSQKGLVMSLNNPQRIMAN